MTMELYINARNTVAGIKVEVSGSRRNGNPKWYSETAEKRSILKYLVVVIDNRFTVKDYIYYACNKGCEYIAIRCQIIVQ